MGFWNEINLWVCIRLLSFILRLDLLLIISNLILVLRIEHVKIGLSEVEPLIRLFFVGILYVLTFSISLFTEFLFLNFLFHGRKWRIDPVLVLFNLPLYLLLLWQHYLRGLA